MTDQFSQEYTDYVLSDEAKALQEKWEPGVGDWLIFNANEYCHRMDAGNHIATVCEVLERGAGLHWGFHVRDTSPSKGWGPHRLVSAKGQDACWLPTLWDLLQIIEGAGWEWSRKPGRWDAWKPTEVPLTASSWSMVENTEDMLAAAKLAVKALKDKSDD